MKLHVLFLSIAGLLGSLHGSAQPELRPHSPFYQERTPEDAAAFVPPVSGLVFPKLLLDSMHYVSTSPTNVTVSIQRNKYNAKEQLVEKIEDAGSTLYHTFHFYNAQGIEQGTHRYRYSGMAVFQDSTAFSYDALGRIVGYLYHNLINNGWVEKHRSTYTYEPDGTVINLEETKQNNVWNPVQRYTILKKPEHSLADYDATEIMANGQWLMTYEVTRDYDNNNYLVTEQTRERQLAAASSPLEPISVREYFYDADYRLDYTRQSTRWNPVLNKWDLIYKTVYEYDASQVLSKVLLYQNDGPNAVSQDLYLTYNEPPYESAKKEVLVQNWNEPAQEYQDHYNYYSAYSDLPDGRTLLYNLDKEYVPTAPNPWQTRTEVSTFYLKSRLSAVEIAPETADCPLPNPYRLHTPVQCPELDANAQYLLQLVNMEGKVVYARYFCGDASWSIDRPLPVGLYAAAISMRGKLVSARQLIIAE